MRTENLQSSFFQLGRPGRPDQKRDISACLSQAATEISTGRPGADDEHPHASLLEAILSMPSLQRGTQVVQGIRVLRRTLMTLEWNCVYLPAHANRPASSKLSRGLRGNSEVESP